MTTNTTLQRLGTRRRVGLVSGLLAASLLAIGASAGAAPGERRHGHGMRGVGPFADPMRAAMLAEQLELSDAQRDTIDDVIARARRGARAHVDALMAARRELRAVRHAGEFDEPRLRAAIQRQASHREELMVHYAKARAEIRAGLTEAQRTALDSMKHRKRGRRKHH